MGAAVSTWLWAKHRDCFERAYQKNKKKNLNCVNSNNVINNNTKNGRQKQPSLLECVDFECKWLIRQAVEISVRAVISEVEHGKKKNWISPTSTVVSPSNVGPSSEKITGSTATTAATFMVGNLRLASCVCEGLAVKVFVNTNLVRNICVHYCRTLFFWRTDCDILSYDNSSQSEYI